ASRWEDDIPHPVKKERLHILTDELTKHTKTYNESLIGKTMRVLVTGTDRNKEFLSGLTEGKLIVRFKGDEAGIIGQFVDVKIDSVTEFATEGTMVDVFQPQSV
ncbi:MAG: TRAM domain-containing protein, partial [Bacteroidota bacterium]